MRIIDADALINRVQKEWDGCEISNATWLWLREVLRDQPTIDAVPVKFIDEVIEYLTECRDYAIHEETKTAWDEQRQTLIMLLHEWAAWNECGRTGKYGEWREG